MNLSNPGYLHLLAQRFDQCERDLNGLVGILALRPWCQLEQAAVARIVYLLIQPCIGAAKHWARREFGFTSSDALQAFTNLSEKNLIESAVPWKKVVGLRNVLVHDYLAVDTDIVREVVERQYYRDLLQFGRAALQALKQ